MPVLADGRTAHTRHNRYSIEVKFGTALHYTWVPTRGDELNSHQPLVSTSSTPEFVMNRPRNRQPRSGKRSAPNSQNANSTPQQTSGSVPTVHQVIPGASVFIILKEDQPTGSETLGVVQDVLTKGNHPRGIKVRLREGQVGRVQRMNKDAAPSTSNGAEAQTIHFTPGSGRWTHRYADVRTELDEYPEAPSERSLADFMPALPANVPALAADGLGAPSIHCPVCDVFEGDEAAVTHHIEQDHFK
ncbi:hypothetical protein DCS_03940 [Drechmeria coniospora]|uniref:UBZ4-type domain-containing protein n=1 Tax=Drechmeria coniospora TaxID=98403 RepID=A0A151GIM0_DRECN|nr:hypothetical protein DCS_03940 [Drechmeria coniospora]KYK56934.1 hypothetical protein DCS_03940 [Drechmeria coniospora]